MKFVLLVTAIIFPCLVSAQQQAPNNDKKIFACAQISALDTFEGEYSNPFDKEEDARPTIVSIPADDVEGDRFSDDRRYYYYVRITRDRDMIASVLYGVFDLRQETLSTSSASFGTGQDGVARSYARSYKWTCTDMKLLK